MIGRSAQAFDDAWEMRTHRAGEAEHLVAVADRLRAESAVVQPSAEFRAGLRMLLMDQKIVPAEPEPVVAPPRRRTLPMASRLSVAGFAAVGGLAMVAGSAQALPGDPLYPVKRAVETALVAIQPSDTGKSHVQLDAAGHRLAEAAQLAERHSAAERGKVAGALADFVDSGDAAFTDLSAGDLDASTTSTLSDFIAASSVTLASLKPALPEAAADEFDAATALLDQLAALLPSPPTAKLSDVLSSPPAAATKTTQGTSTSPSPKGGQLQLPILVPGAPLLPLGPTSPTPTEESSLTSGIEGIIPNLLNSLLN